jgi:hypothetical protein
MSSTSLGLAGANALSPAIAASKPSELSLDVLSGLHYGVRAPIDAEACTIGSSPGCDLVLSDGGIANEHLNLRFYGRQVAVNATGGAVTIEGQPTLQRGYGCRAKLPLTLMVGDAKLRIVRNTTSAPIIGRWGPYAAVLAVVLVMTPLVAVQAGISELLPQKARSPNDNLIVGSLPTMSVEHSDAAIIESLQLKIDQAKIGALTLSTDGRRIDVSGQVSPERMEAWRDVQRWFDHSHGGRFVLVSLVSAAAAADAPKFTFQAVFFGENPYVVDARGERRYPGAALQDGWMLKSIENGQILVARGGQEFKLTL